MDALRPTTSAPTWTSHHASAGSSAGCAPHVDLFPRRELASDPFMAVGGAESSTHTPERRNGDSAFPDGLCGELFMNDHAAPSALAELRPTRHPREAPPRPPSTCLPLLGDDESSGLHMLRPPVLQLSSTWEPNREQVLPAVMTSQP